jgi:hypothetical protein
VKVFPHPFVPFLHVREKEYASKTSPKVETAVVGQALGRVFSERPITLDVEKAIEIMLDAKEVATDAMRQHFRLHLIKSLPPEAIDWKSIDWVQATPFKTNRA